MHRITINTKQIEEGLAHLKLKILKEYMDNEDKYFLVKFNNSLHFIKVAKFQMISKELVKASANVIDNVVESIEVRDSDLYVTFVFKKTLLTKFNIEDDISFMYNNFIYKSSKGFVKIGLKVKFYQDIYNIYNGIESDIKNLKFKRLDMWECLSYD